MAEVIDRQVSERTPERELRTFLLWAFGISWGIGVAGSVVLGPAAYVLGVFGPAVAALWVTKRFEGDVRSLWSHLVRWRISAGWYVVALVLPLTLVAGAFAIVSSLGGTWDLVDPVSPLAAPLFLAFAFFVAGGPEELGWRGYVLPRLQSRWGALTSSLILGVIWAVWHAPLWFMPDLAFAELSFPLYAVQILAMCVVFTWLYNSTGGSVLLAVLLHASVNLAAGYLATSLRAQVVLAALWIAAAAVLVRRYGARDLARSVRVDRDEARRRAVRELRLWCRSTRW